MVGENVKKFEINRNLKSEIDLENIRNLKSKIDLEMMLLSTKLFIKKNNFFSHKPPPLSYFCLTKHTEPIVCFLPQATQSHSYTPLDEPVVDGGRRPCSCQ